MFAGLSCQVDNPAYDLNARPGGDLDGSIAMGGQDAAIPRDGRDAPATQGGNDAAVTTLSCTDTTPCVCNNGLSCNLMCESECRATCDGSSTQCLLKANAVANLHAFLCSNGAVCKAELTNSSNAFPTCSNGATCDIRCLESSNCAVSCTTGASCQLRCTTTSNCGFSTCEGTSRLCADGVIVCNRLCP
jgi:hypothetical protein